LFAQGELAFDFAPSFPGAGELLPQGLVRAVRVKHVALII
jgi:hypothetical protein